MRTVQQTDLHCELTGLSVLRGLSGKPEPGRLKTEADSELLWATLKSLTISSMTGISESLYNSATPVQHCDLACTNIKRMKMCTRKTCAPALSEIHGDEKHANLGFQCLTCIPAFGFAKPHPQKNSPGSQLLSSQLQTNLEQMPKHPFTQ